MIKKKKKSGIDCLKTTQTQMHIQSHNKNSHAYAHVANDHIWMYMKVNPENAAKVVKHKVLF